MTSLYTSLVSRILFPLQERFKRHTTVEVLEVMNKTQWLSAVELSNYQSGKLSDFLHNVAVHVPYYKKIFAENKIDPSRIKSTSELVSIPFLTKSLIRENFNELISDKAGELARFNTGGSSGEPLVFLIGNERVSHDVAAKWRATRWWGVDIGDPEIVVWGSPIELGSQDKLRGLRDALMRSTLLAAFEMSTQNLEIFIKKIQKVRPKMLFGYPSALSHIAQYAENHQYKMNDLGIKVAFVTSERLYEYQRKIIERIFNCKVANGYGGRDAGFIAHECPNAGMHITAEDIIVEIVDTNGNVLAPGNKGEIVITHLATSEFPFIRYKTGDIGALDIRLCTCGRGLFLLKEVEGRATDFVVAQDGTVMHGLALIYILRDLSGLEAFKIVQESIDNIKVYIVTKPDFMADNKEYIKSQFKKRLGATVAVDIYDVNEIPREKSGKYRYIISKVSANNS